jgi:hypothetical protein
LHIFVWIEPKAMSASAIGWRRLTIFYVPIALQAAAQSLTYPLVAMVASRGPGGALNLAGIAQANLVMFLIGTVGGGLVTAGLVFGRSRQGFERFFAANMFLACLCAVVQALLSIPFCSHLVFGTLLGLPGSIEGPARIAFPLMIPMNFLFFMRNPYQVMLYNNEASVQAGTATLGRVILTLLLSLLFSSIGLVGPVWAVVCQTIPVGGEALFSWWLSRPYSVNFKPDIEPPPRMREILNFNTPLSIGSFIMTLAGMLVSAFITRAPQPEHMLTAYVLALGLANPAAYAASRITPVAICFPPTGPADRFVRNFTTIAGTIVSFMPLAFILPGISQWYYIGMQKLPAADLPLVATTALALFGYPLVVAWRSYQEGLASVNKRPSNILAGNIAYLAMLLLSGTLLLTLRVSGNLIGPLAIILSNLAALAVIVYLQRVDLSIASIPGRGAVPQDSP